MGSEKSIIICVDDEFLVLETLQEQLLRFFGRNHELELAQGGLEALKIIESLKAENLEVPAIICDHLMPDLDGATLLEKIDHLYPEIIKITLTDQTSASDIGRMVNKANLFGYLPKPWKETDLFFLVKEAIRRYEHEKTIDEQTKRLDSLYQQALEEIENRKKTQDKLEEALKEISTLKERLKEERVYLKTRFRLEPGRHRIIGNSEAIQYVLYRVEKVALSDTTVLILGETGTGKELIAEAIYNMSPRTDRPFIRVNCAALPAELIESELFGHEKGAFTGAHARKIGKFELANGGTLFLDEIGELPLILQAKILRALESKEFERLGGVKTIQTDVRIIAATNRNLEEEIENGSFRKDLYYRLNVYPITVPPLRQRKEDIGPLVNHFVETFNKKIGRSITQCSQKTLSYLMAYTWPGNVRELENVIERGMILSASNELNIDALDHPKKSTSEHHSLEDVERQTILQALHTTNGKISGRSGAAEYLNVNANTLRSKMKKLGIDKEEVRYTH